VNRQVEQFGFISRRSEAEVSHKPWPRIPGKNEAEAVPVRWAISPRNRGLDQGVREEDASMARTSSRSFSSIFLIVTAEVMQTPERRGEPWGPWTPYP